jgi:hypothetical protein
MRKGMKGVIVLRSLNKYFIHWGHNAERFGRCHHTLLTVWSMYWKDGVRWHLSYLFLLWPHCMKYLLSVWSMMTPSKPFRIVTSMYEIFIEWTEYDDTFHTFSYSEVTMRKGLKGVPLQILHTVSSQWKKVWKVSSYSIHLSFLFSLWPHCMKYLLRGWSTMTPFKPILIVISLYEIFIEGMEYDDTFQTFVIVLHPFNKNFSQWSHNEQRYERYHRIPSP